ncbi:hypothetical protein PV762_17625 [Mitsuaria sp. CC2]|uniref:hypothetical protein n=1 Tax=Mitsuaria sp. CC2 TaxID=3029186 RepID=UPI003B8B1A6C
MPSVLRSTTPRHDPRIDAVTDHAPAELDAQELVASHRSALCADQQELDRLTTALASLGPSARFSNPEVAAAHDYAEGAQLRINAAHGDLDDGRLDRMGEHVNEIQKRTAYVRQFLARQGIIPPVDRPTAALHPATTSPLHRRSAPGKVSPSTVLHSALSHLARTAKSARKALVRHIPFPGSQQAKAAARQDRATVRSPMRVELSQLSDDIKSAEKCRDELFDKPAPDAVGGAGGHARYVRHTLGILLAEARKAEARALRAAGGGAKADAVVSQAITTIRSKLERFNRSLRIAELDTVNFKFLQRDWPAGTGAPG